MNRGRPPQLTAAAVRYLRRWRAERQAAAGKRVGPSAKQLCNRYGITDNSLYQAACGHTYRWVQ